LRDLLSRTHIMYQELYSAIWRGLSQHYLTWYVQTYYLYIKLICLLDNISTQY